MKKLYMKIQSHKNLKGNQLTLNMIYIKKKKTQQAKDGKQGPSPRGQHQTNKQKCNTNRSGPVQPLQATLFSDEEK